MAHSHKRPPRTRRSPKPKPVFRSGVAAEMVDELLLRFVTLVKHGLVLMLTTPSELAGKEFRQQLALSYTAADIPALLVWLAQSAYELSGPALCQHILSHPPWQAVLGVQTQAELDALLRVVAGFGPVQVRLIELAVHDAFKEGDKQALRSADQQPPVHAAYAEAIGASRVLKLLKKRLRALLRRLDAQDPPHPPHPRHRPRTYRMRSFLLADLLRWLLHLNSTEELRRRLKEFPHLAGAVNFQPGAIPSKATFSHRRLAIPLADLKAILHELVAVLTRMKVIDGRAWLVDLTRLPTYSSVSKEYPDRPNGKSDPEAAFCGYPDNDGGYQFGYSLLFVVDFKTELPFALLFAGGSVHDSPLAVPLLEQAQEEHLELAARCEVAAADGSYDTIAVFAWFLNRLRALPVITKNPRNAADPHADLTTDALCILRRPSPWHTALFHSRTAVERTNGRIKLTFNLRYHKNRGRNAVEHAALFAAIAMLAAAWVAVETGHPEKIRAAWTWINFQ
ncbi:MAG: transposase [Chloroflexi bacterium]|nr:transposase [Chloroflexota bacterium]